jgi:hypothetical protein
MIDQQLVRLRTHRSNIQRYRNLLQTSLTELERKFVEQRLTEEQSNLESLINSLPNDFCGSNAGRWQRFVRWRTDNAFELGVTR